jgi:uncharacterized surface protein with fasciclin (FAS1) repeats
MKSGTKVFQHFLSKSNLSQILEGLWVFFSIFIYDNINLKNSLDTTKSFIILVPTDSAFQRWHPIDWGFYPFSVSEFTENIMMNHVIEQKQPFNLKNIDKEHKMKTVGGEFVIFKNIRKIFYSPIYIF